MFFSFKEELLHYLWKYQLFTTPDLKTKSGKSLHIIRQGMLQPNAGPDFIQAKIQIDQLVLAGNIEIHVQESEWIQHKHHVDPSYNTVILHVVWESKNTFTHLENQQQVEILELWDRVDTHLLARYEVLMSAQRSIPCAALYKSIDESLLHYFFHGLCVGRLERKVTDIQQLLEYTNNDWNQVVFMLLARYMGSSINNDAFQQLASTIPVNVLHKNSDQPKIIEAILFGQSGLLAEYHTDDYPVALNREYQYQKRLHALESIQPAAWKFAKLRPASFPNIRIAQLAALMAAGKWSIEQLIDIASFAAFQLLFDVNVNSYWITHYDFERERGEAMHPSIGDTLMNTLFINFFVPLVFAYGKQTDNEALCEKALLLLDTSPFEKNKVTNAFTFLQVTPTGAVDSQALIELYGNFCTKGRCLDCSIGNSILCSKKEDS